MVWRDPELGLHAGREYILWLDPHRYVANAMNLDNLGPAGFLYLNLALAALIPTAGLSIWIAHRIRPRYLSSVAGGLRWKWLLRCVLVTLPV